MRLFVALVPPTAVREELARRVAERRASFPPASWVREENLHATLLFLGEVAERELPALRAALTSAVRKSFRMSVRIRSAGAFPPAGRVRVVWVGLEPAEELGSLAAAVREGAERSAVPFDARPFRAHLTLARCRNPWPAALRARLSELAPARLLGFDAAAVELVESRLGAGGARYRTLAELPLGEVA